VRRGNVSGRRGEAAVRAIASAKAASAPGIGIVVVEAARSTGFPVTHDNGRVIAHGTRYASTTDDARFRVVREAIAVTRV
jgi:hypothetical protein